MEFNELVYISAFSSKDLRELTAKNMHTRINRIEISRKKIEPKRKKTANMTTPCLMVCTIAVNELQALPWRS